MDKFEELDKLIDEIKSKTYSILDLEDVGKEGVIVDIERIQTSFNKTKIKVLIDINKTIKVAFVNLLTFVDWLRKSNATHAREILGKKVRIVLVEVLNPTTKQIMQKPKPYIIVGDKNEK